MTGSKGAAAQQCAAATRLADLGAPRGALSYSPCSGRELEEVFSDLMAYP